MQNSGKADNTGEQAPEREAKQTRKTWGGYTADRETGRRRREERASR